MVYCFDICPGSSTVPNSIEDPLKACHILKSKRYSNIAPKKSSANSTPNTSVNNIVRQAWLDCQSSENEADKSIVSGSSTQKTSDQGTKKAKLKDGLPKPTFFERKTPPSRKTKTRRKQKLVAKEREFGSSDDESSKFIAQLQSEIETPKNNEIANISNNSDNMTSTPFKQSLLPSNSPNLTSPIHGLLTPLRTSAFLDNSFLECLKDCENVSTGKEMILSPDVLCAKNINSSQLRTPNSSRFNMNLFTPPKYMGDNDMGIVSDQHNQSLSKFLSDFPIDMEDPDAFPVDLSGLNWSNLDNDQNFINISPLRKDQK